MRAAPTTNHIAAIHVLKSKLQLSDDDYQALLIHLTGKASSKDMTAVQRSTVRNHMQRLAERVGAVQPTAQRPYAPAKFDQLKANASPKERKVWALWHQLGRDGVVHNTSAAALASQRRWWRTRGRAGGSSRSRARCCRACSNALAFHRACSSA